LNILVAGATGVLGRSLVPLLRGRGHAVRGLARSARAEETVRGLGGEPVRGDLLDPAGLEAAARGCQAVLHLATSIPTRRRLRYSDFALNDRVRTEGTRNLLAAALAAGARRYVQQSVAFLHQTAAEEWADEDSPLADSPALGSAIEMERLVWQSHGLDGLSTIIVRGGSFYGPGSPHTRRMFDALRRGLLPLAGAGDNYWSLIHVDDMAGACAAAAEAARPAQCYLAVDDEPVRVRELFTAVARARGGPAPRRWPEWLIRLLAGAPALDLLRASFRCRNARILRDLGWRPAYPTFREGIPAVLRAWKRRA
jgi:nucleoside-diphosphate-sugar epimerase